MRPTTPYARLSRYARALLRPEFSSLRTAGEVWYEEARILLDDIRYVARGLNRPYLDSAFAAANIVAVLSPGVSWSMQRARTTAFVRKTLLGDAPSYPGYSANVAKARALIHGEAATVSGPKVIAFRDALFGDRYSVTLDRHALTAATGRVRPKWMPSQSERATILSAYRRAAALCGMNPRNFQAAVWLLTRVTGAYARG